MDPFRTNHRAGVCPRCKGTIESDGGDRLVCLAGCGEWTPRTVIERFIEWEQLENAPPYVPAWPWGASPCPICTADMTTAFRDEIRFDRCGLHGIWLDAGEARRFLDSLRAASGAAD